MMISYDMCTSKVYIILLTTPKNLYTLTNMTYKYIILRVYKYATYIRKFVIEKCE